MAPMRVVWRYADILEPGIQSVMMAGTTLMLVLCADNLDLHIKVIPLKNRISITSIVC